MSYWDTSALVKLYAKEPDSSTFEQFALNAPATATVTSRIALYEALATFRRKEAEGILVPGAAQTLYSELVQDIAAGEIRLVDLSADVERQYGRVLTSCYGQQPILPLRTLDAPHLASALATAQAEIVATDKRVRSAAKLLGLALFPA